MMPEERNNRFRLGWWSTFLLLALLLSALTGLLAGCQEDGAKESGSPSSAGAGTALSPVTETPSSPVEGALTLETTAVPVTVTPSQETAQPAQSASGAVATSTPTPQSADVSMPDGPRPDGALVAVHMDSEVGVLLDEIPASMRDRVAAAILDRPDSFWQELAHRQVRLTLRRLNFRNFFYDNKGQLPLPPQSLWTYELDPAGPARKTVQNGATVHDVVAIDYTFRSTLLTDADSPAAAEPALAEAGGQWKEPFVLPLDPDLLLQRTGNACLNEAGFPPNSFDSENAWVYFDHTCQADSGGQLGCHRTRLAQLSCQEALGFWSGTVETEMEFERLEWDDQLADAVRLGEVTVADQPDLKVIGDDLAVNRLIYRYFPADSCALLEQCVSGSGWRRLLQFNATVHNVGGAALHIGPVVAEDPEHNLFQYNACHDHYHFSDYGDFYFAEEEKNLSSKQAFCVESTNRLSNNEWSPLTHNYTCRFQGVQAGWVDEYVAGLDCQWIDITDADIPNGEAPFTLGFHSNPDKFLCEGSPILDENGNPLWEDSGLTTPDGQPIQRPQCDFVPGWDVNNDDSRPLLLAAKGSFVTEPCSADQLGPLRNCDFSEQLDGLAVAVQETPEAPTPETPASSDPFLCTPGQQTQLTCRLDQGNRPQVARICDYSYELSSGVACAYEDALANAVVGDSATVVAFTCPMPRDEQEPGGRFSLYTAPVFAQDPSQPIRCQVGQ